MPGFGDPYARVVIVGLAPAAHGGNRTGRIFTGDPSARFLMGTLYDVGFASQPTSESRDDGLRFRDLYITASVKCAPPDDRPTVKERVNCLPYLRGEFGALRRVRVAVVLGRIAFDAFLDYVATVRGTRPQVRFEHGAFYSLGPGLPLLAVSYHVSPRNTVTGRLTREQFVEFLHRVRQQAELE